MFYDIGRKVVMYIYIIYKHSSEGEHSVCLNVIIVPYVLKESQPMKTIITCYSAIMKEIFIRSAFHIGTPVN